MTKRLVYVFGPDGAGKSTVVDKLHGTLPQSVVMNGSYPETWPDQSWYEEIAQRGLDVNTLDPAFHIESMRRCYRVAGRLLCAGAETVILDSDLRAKATAKASAWYGHQVPMADIYGQLHGLTTAELGVDTQQIGLHVTLGGDSPEARAQVLMNRISGRDEATSFYDPTTIDAATSLAVAFDGLEAVLLDRHEPVVRVETDQPYDIAAIAGQIAIA